MRLVQPNNSVHRLGIRITATVLAALFLLPLSAVPAVAKWTVLVYMAGDNNLENGQIGVENIRDMESVPASEDLNVLVQFDRPGNNEFASYSGARRYLIRSRGQEPGNEEIASLLLQELGTVNMGDPSSLVDFVRYGVENYPADHYFLVLWNHGTGWETLPYREAQNAVNFLDAEEDRPLNFRGTYQAIAYDDGSQDSITALELWEAFERIKYLNGGRKIDVVGFDACLMGMIEVGTQIAHGARIMVASEEITPESGWNYREFIGYLANNPDATPQAAARAVIDGFVSLYRTLSQEVVLSAVDLDRLDGLLDGVGRFTEALLAEPRHVLAVREARSKTKMFDNQAYLDLADLADRVAVELPGTSVAKRALELSSMVGDTSFMLDLGKTGISNLNAHGLAVYFPLLEANLEKYSSLDFAALTGWDRYLAAHFRPGVAVLKPVETFLSETNQDGVVSPGETFTAGFRLEREEKIDGRSRAVKVRYRFTADNDAVVVVTPPGSTALDFDDSILNIEFSGKVDSTCLLDTQVMLELVLEGENVATVRHRVPLTISRPFSPTSDVLLVVGTKEDKAATVLLSDLEILGITVDVWELKKNGPVHSSMLDHYLPGLVIRPVENGTDELVQVSSSEQLVLDEYAARGGSLLLYGQDIGYKLGGSEFFENICRTKFVRDNTSIYNVASLPSARFIPGLSFKIDGGDGSQKWPDELDPISPAVPILKYMPEDGNEQPNRRSRYGGRATGGGLRGSGSAGVAVEENGHRVVCLAFGLHGVEPNKARRKLTETLVVWLRSGGSIDTYMVQPVSADTSPVDLMRSFKLRSKIEEGLLLKIRVALEQGDLTPAIELVDDLLSRAADEQARVGSLIRQLRELMLYQMKQAETGDSSVPLEQLRLCLGRLNSIR